MKNQTYEDRTACNAAFLSPEEAEAEAWAKGLFLTIIRVALCAAAIAVLVLSYFFVWIVPLLQIVGVMSLIVIASIVIDRFVQSNKH